MIQKVFFTVLFLLATGSAAKIPSWIAAPSGGPPIWMSAEEARHVDGSLRWELFPPSMREDLEARVEMSKHLRAERGLLSAAARKTCQTYRVSTSGLSLPDTSFGSFLDYAELAVVGRVSGVAEGFYRGQVSMLVEVEVERVLKRPGSIAPFSRLYFQFSHAEVSAEGVMLCVRNDHYPDRPTIGRHVVLFADSVPDREPLIVVPHGLAVIFEREDGSVSLGWERGSFVGKRPDWSLVEKQLANLETDSELHPKATGEEEQE